MTKWIKLIKNFKYKVYTDFKTLFMYPVDEIDIKVDYHKFNIERYDRKKLWKKKK